MGQVDTPTKEGLMPKERKRHSIGVPYAAAMTATLTMMMLSFAAPAMAEEDPAVPGRNGLPASSQQGPSDPAELEAFLDELMAQDMEEHHIAGAAVSVVKDGSLFFSKGYGYADLEAGIPVDPEQTIFRIGSVTKLFTWTAVMQLVEQGKLDLDADINDYLDFRIPDTYPQPITLKHLLTHTPGFEDVFFEVLATDTDDQTPAREWLMTHMPARVRPPGELAAYSNYGTSLAGYIVARVSGQTYDQYIRENILVPLGMLHSTAESPLPPQLRAQASLGYTYVDGAFQAFPDYLGQPAFVPAGAMSVSATDAARFMIAHLQGGFYGDAAAEVRILEEATTQQMHGTLFTHDPRILGTAYGLFDFSDSGQRTIGHSGEAHPFNALMLLLPDQNLGIYVAYNSEGGGHLTNQHLGFQRAFFDHYYSEVVGDPVEPPADFSERAGRFVGTYRLTRGSYSTLEKIMGIMGGVVEISDAGDGTLLFATPYGDWRFVEVEPLYFRQVDAPFGLAFREDDRGRISHAYADITPMFAFEKLAWYETAEFGMALALGCVLIFLSVIPVASIRSIRNRRSPGDRKPEPRGAGVARGIILGICVLNLLFLVGTVLWGEPNLRPLFGVSLIYKIVLGLGVLSAVLTVGAVVSAVLAWKNSYWGVGARAYYTLVTIAAVGFVWFLHSWNLLGWRF
jgi:CubicO group peptidase (beta-lactamase class C family)